jgi:hypothetical protein
MTSWPAVWAASGVTDGTNKQEIDSLEYFDTGNASSTLHDWVLNADGVGDPNSPSHSSAIDPSLFANADTTGVEVATLINTNNDTISSYINGQQVSSFNINSNDPAATTPINWLLGTGTGEPMDVTNMALYTPANQS